VSFKAVIFDLYWTLLYEEETGLMDRAVALVAKAGADPEEWHKAWHQTLEPSWRNEVSLLGRARDSLKCAGAQVCDGELAEELAGLMAARSTPRLYGDVRESLAKVKEMGYTMGLISNISSHRAGWLREIELTPFFDMMALSCELGVAKPARAIYLAAAEGLGVKPEECVFVDDVPPYVQAARNLGMATVRINRFGSDDIYREYYDDLDFEADLRIEGLGELVAWLEAKRGD
jgi:putative hydrolase of the HAD superfamily